MADSGRATTSPTHRVPLRVLLVEDSEADAELLLEELRRGGYEPTWERVDTATALTAALTRESWDVIICDWVMPQFGGPAALALLQERRVDVPIIIVSGQVGEKYAVTAMKAGAHDFISKRNLARLCPAIERELQEVQVRRARRDAEEALRENEARLDLALRSARMGVWQLDIIENRRHFDDQTCHLLGTNPATFTGTAEEFFAVVHPDDRETVTAALARTIEQEVLYEPDYRAVWPDGSVHVITARGRLVRDGEGRPARINGIIWDITERKRAERSIELMNFALNNVREAAFLTDERGCFHYVNEESCRALGYTRDELLGLGVSDVDPDFPSERWSSHWDELKTQHALIFEGHHRAKDGRIFPVEINANYFEYDGQTYNLALVRDITERKRAEAQKEQYLKFFMLSTDPMCIADPFGCFRQVNPAFVQLTDYTESELASKPFLEFVLPEDRQRTAVEMALQVNVRPSLNFENRYLRKDGSVFVLSWTAYFDRKDGLTYATARDITERKRAEETILHLAHRNSLVLNAAGQGIIGLERQGYMTFANEAAAKMLGTRVEDLIGKHSHSVWHHTKSDGTPYPSEECPIYAAYCDGAIRRGADEVFWRTDRTAFPVEYVSTPIRENGNVVGAVVVFDDITERKRAEKEIRALNAELDQRVEERTAQLAAVNKELEAFSYSVSHDLRAPLRAVDGFSTMLLDRYGPQFDAQGRHYLQRVQEGAQRMDELINDLLVLARITRSEMSRQSVDLSTLARTIATDLRKTQPERQVEFVIADGVVVEGDAGLLRAALANLLGNAWKYTSKHATARIEFGVSHQDGQPVYFVRDDGAGFDMTYVGKLFGAFKRLHAAEDFEGTGIGLATVQRIIHRHGGRVWAEGAVERGATFYFTLAPSSSNE